MNIVTVYFRDASPPETHLGVNSVDNVDGSYFIYQDGKTVVYPRDIVFKMEIHAPQIIDGE